jgi:hypothetical protein
MFFKYCSILAGVCALELGDARIHNMVASMNVDDPKNVHYYGSYHSMNILERGHGVRGAFIKSCDGNHESLKLQQISYDKETE